MLSVLTVVLLLGGSLAITFAVIWGLGRIGCFDDTAGPAYRRMPVRRPVAVPLGPDDDLAFLRELGRRIDLGHFRR